VIEVEGLLLDLDGTLVVSGEAIPGAAEAVRVLRDRGLPFRFATNATSATRAELARWLGGIGVEVKPDDMLTAPVVAAAYLRAHHAGARCLLLGEGGAAADLDGVELVPADDPGPVDVVLFAGADRLFTWDRLNVAYRAVLDGASIVAMHRNVAWRTSEGMTLDTGAFLIGIERAAGVEATVIGKPSEAFFRQAVELLGVPADRTAMVGDDLDNDVLAAQDFGLTGVLVSTGKFRQSSLDEAERKPDHVIDSVADLPGLLRS
jgi:HAD superfamily hydrolase (TIGR01458 family)